MALSLVSSKATAAHAHAAVAMSAGRRLCWNCGPGETPRVPPSGEPMSPAPRWLLSDCGGAWRAMAMKRRNVGACASSRSRGHDTTRRATRRPAHSTGRPGSGSAAAASDPAGCGRVRLDRSGDAGYKYASCKYKVFVCSWLKLPTAGVRVRVRETRGCTGQTVQGENAR